MDVEQALKWQDGHWQYLHCQREWKEVADALADEVRRLRAQRMKRETAEALVDAFGKATLRADATRYSGWCDDLQIARGKQDQALAALLRALTGESDGS